MKRKHFDTFDIAEIGGKPRDVCEGIQDPFARSRSKYISRNVRAATASDVAGVGIDYAFATFLDEESLEFLPKGLRAFGGQREKSFVAVIRRVVLLDEVADVDFFLPHSIDKSLPRRNCLTFDLRCRCCHCPNSSLLPVPNQISLRSDPVCRAIMSSSLVGMVQADTRPPDFEIQGPPALLASSSSSIPSHDDAAQIRF